MEKWFEEIITSLLGMRLQEAIGRLKRVYERQASLVGLDELETIEKEFGLMKNYLLQGVTDPRREELYHSLLERTFRVTSNLYVDWQCANVGIYVEASRRAANLNMSHDFLRTVLETFVSDAAMLSLESGEAHKSKSAELYGRHQEFVERLFNAIWTSFQWKAADQAFYEQILLSPTVDTADQMLLVSAITLGTLNHFDINKFKTLVEVYRQSDTPGVKERALVGWVISLHDSMTFMPEQQAIVRQLCDDEAVVRDLYNLQIQLFATLDTEKDSDEIQRNIMPDLVNNSNITITRFGITERQDDPTEDILNPNADDERMEKMEEGLRRMADMQRQGSDIYFGGFSKMKNFPFFRGSIANWFAPFRIEHPDLQQSVEKFANRNFLSKLMDIAQLCESDKYSLALIMSEVVGKLPKDMVEMMGSEETFAQMADPKIDRNDRAFIRRLYIQDLYRFYKLRSGASSLVSPFQDKAEQAFESGVFFFEYEIFKSTKLDSRKLNLANYLYKHRKYNELTALLATFQSHDPAQDILTGYSKLCYDEPQEAIEHFDKALEIVPDNDWALRGKARAAMTGSDFELAAETYARLLDLNPHRRNFIINYCVALLKTDRTKQALELLYKETYDRPDDKDLKRLMAWAQLCNGEAAKAASIYAVLLADAPTPEDYLNAGYAHWLTNDIASAANCFRHWVSQSELTIYLLLEEFKRDRPMLRSNGIGEIDETLMAELLQD